MPDDTPDGGYFQPKRLEADFIYWAKMATWTDEDAASVLLGLNPDFMRDSREVNYGAGRPHFDRYWSLKTLIKRAVAERKVSFPLTPAKVRLWASSNGVPIPEALNAAIERWGEPQSVIATSEMVRIDELNATIRRLNSRIAELEGGAQIVPKAKRASSDELGTRERETMLKLIIGLAKAVYGYDPAAKRGEAVKEIRGDFEKLGLSLSDDTIRKYLREGAELLPPQKNQDR